MPVLTLGQCISTATTMAGRSDWQTSEASLYANLALEAVCEAAGANYVPREALAVSSTTSGGNRIGIPTDFVAPMALTLYMGSSATTGSRNTVSIPLIQRDAQFLDSQPGQTLGGIPEWYLWTGSWIELFPSPNSAYSLQLRYQASVPALTSSSETPALMSRWHQAWLYKTVELLHASRKDPEGELLARNRYLNYVTTLRTDLGNRQQDKRSMTLRRGW